jgi:HSP20 family protein
VNRAFRELEEELGDLRQTKDDEIFDWMAAMTAATMDGGQAKDIFETIDKKTAKKWIEKAFDLAFEFNQDFTDVQGERDATEEILRKSRDWVAGLYEEEAKETEQQTTADHDESDRWSSTDQSDTSPVSPERDSEEPEKKPTEIASETPDSENRSNDKVFEVSVDLPGVDRTDVDISVEEDYLLVRAERKTGSDGEKYRMYTKEVPFPENEVDVDKLEASFKNGVLVVSAPKLESRKDKKRKIPITYY